jgi:hypothetical protein
MRERDTPVDPTRALRQRGDLIVLVGTSTRVLEDCRFPGGALVDAPSQLPSFPVGARDGLIVRPGETFPLAILAGDGLRRDERPGLLGWLDGVLPGDDAAGPLRRSYRPDGATEDAAPDRLGTALLLWAIGRRPRLVADPLSRSVMARLAAGTVSLAGREGPDTRDTGAVASLLDALLADPIRRSLATLHGEESAPVLGGLSGEVERLIPAVLAELREWDGRTLPGWEGHDESDGGDTWRWLPTVSMLGWLDDVPRGVRAAAVETLERRLLGAERPGHPVPVAVLFELAIALEQMGRSERADDVFSAALDLADRDGHFQEWAGTAPGSHIPASPWLPAHMAFVWAAGVLGRLADLPRSGYTSARRRSAGA